MNELTFTVVEIEPHDGFAVLWVSVGASNPSIYASGSFGIQVPQATADLNTVGAPLVL